MIRVDADRLLRRAGVIVASGALEGEVHSPESGVVDLEWAILLAGEDVGASPFEAQIALDRLYRRVGPPSIDNERRPRSAPEALRVLLDALDEPSPARHHKVLASIGTGTHEQLLELVRPTFACYARRHGYDLELRTESLDASRPVSWSKIPLLLDLLHRYEFVLWIDSDAAIVDPSQDIEGLLGENPIGMVSLHTAEAADNPNMGVLALRAGRETTELLSALWLKTEYLNHRWWENAALLDHLGYVVDPAPRLVRPSPVRDRITFLPRPWNTVPGAVSDGPPRIVHYPGHSQDARLEHLGNALTTLMINLDAQASERSRGSGP